MKVESLGDAAYVLRDLDRPAFEVAATFNRVGLPGLFEAVASYESVGLYVDPLLFDCSLIGSVVFDSSSSLSGRVHKIPVCYEMGPDTEEVCDRLNFSASSLVEFHQSQSYRCYAVGFCPGFAYLGYLPSEIAGLPRKATPRVRIEPGSVAITGRQTAVYPMVRPGGWWLIGKTPMTLVDVESDYFPIQAGDEVCFYGISALEYDARLGERL